MLTLLTWSGSVSLVFQVSLEWLLPKLMPVAFFIRSELWSVCGNQWDPIYKTAWLRWMRQISGPTAGTRVVHTLGGLDKFHSDCFSRWIALNRIIEPVGLWKHPAEETRPTKNWGQDMLVPVCFCLSLIKAAALLPLTQHAQLFWDRTRTLSTLSQENTAVAVASGQIRVIGHGC